MNTPGITKYGFRIRTRQGMLVDNLLIHGVDEADAERKLRQMYQHCEILERTEHQGGRRRDAASFEKVLALVTK